MLVHMPVRHARGGGHPEELEMIWIPACSGMTTLTDSYPYLRKEVLHGMRVKRT